MSPSASKLLDRETELSTLEEAHGRAGRGQPQLVLLWGRRRAGKTFLLSHFALGKRAVVFGATQQSQTIELSRLHEAVRRDLGENVANLAGGGFTGWEASLRFLVAVADIAQPDLRLGGPAATGASHALLVILDEVPYLARSTPGFASIIQTVWDQIAPGTKIMIVLCGSAIGVMEDIQGARGPLRGRPTTTMRLDPVAMPSARLFLPRLGAADLIEAYAACGGYPLHLKQWDEQASLDDNMFNMAGNAGRILLEDATGILREELPETGGYTRILAAIGRGANRFSEIASQAGQRIEVPLEILMRAGFVRKSSPVGAPRGARGIYEIGDPYLAFWFGVLYSDIPQIEAGQGRQVWRRKQPAWQRHLGWVFEEAARAHAVRLVDRGELPGDLVIGRWWSTSGEPAEVDVLGLKGARSALVGEARWQQKPLGVRDLARLKAKTARVPRPTDDLLLAFWGRTGIERGLRGGKVLGFDAQAMLA